MKFPFRRKPLALLVCYGFTSSFAGGPISEAHAQGIAPLRVDPALLGLPSPAQQPALTPRALPPAVVATPADTAERQPLAAPEHSGVRTESSAEKKKKTAKAKSDRASSTRIPAAAVAPQPAPSVAKQGPAPLPAQTGVAVVALPARNPREDSRSTAAPAMRSGDSDKNWLQRLWSPVDNAYSNGATEIYLPFHTHHVRRAYAADKIATYQEHPWGLGVGRGLYNEKGNWEGVYALGFQDSHFKPQWMAGYSWKTFWRPSEDLRVGLGYTAFLMSRTDILHYVPFPGIVPVASLSYKNLSLETTYVPGGAGAGNIFFIWAKWEMGKPGEAIGTPARRIAPEPVAAAVSGSVTSASSYSFGAADGMAISLRDQAAPAGASQHADEIAPVDDTPALALRLSRSMVPPPAKTSEARPAFLTADRIYGLTERETVAEGDAELRKVGSVLNADRMSYWPLDDEVEAMGNVRLVQGEDVIVGPKMRMKLEDEVGYFEQPSYFIKRQARDAGKPSTTAQPSYGALTPLAGQSSWGFSTAPVGAAADRPLRPMTEARGQAERIDFEGENQIRVSAGTYTTCKPGNDDWYASAQDIKLDYDREQGVARNGTLYFKDVPILYSPWLSFSLNNQRTSGFLAPTFGSTSKSGFELTLPYYWNIAPNVDATIAPRAFTKRGLQLNTEVRYLDAAYNGQARVELLPDDKVRNENRYGFSLQHNHIFGAGFAGAINFNKVSDSNYYTDLSSRIANTSQTQLLQQGVLSYGGGGWWTAVANMQSYQTLQPDPNNPVAEPYRLLPQLTVNARRPDLYSTDSSFLGQFTAFAHPTNVEARRTVLYPQVALPYETPGWYVTPKLGLHATYYSLSRQAAGTPDTLSRTLPVLSVDSGMTFERPSSFFGRDYTQTLEPRLFYLNVPYRDQSRIPIFDSGLADFNFAQIFSENQFAGQDRFSDANQLTAAVSSRLIDPATGGEVMRAMLGQRFYFRDQQVTLPDQSKRVWTKSDFLAAFSGQVLPRVYADAALQYNVENSRTERYSLGARYAPEPGKVLNAAYRFNRDAIDQFDISGQWPIFGGWHAVGRMNYSLKDRQPIENIAGLEYDGGCWVVRLVGQRLATATGTASTAVFFQLELNDFSRIGSNPLELLKRSVQGYGKINQPTADPVFGQ